MTNTQKPFLLMGKVWAASIIPSPIHAQATSVFATGFYDPLQPPHRKGGFSVSSKLFSSG